MRRGVVLHLLAGAEVVFADALRWAAQAGLTHPARQGAVGDIDAALGEQFLDTHRIAARPREGRLQFGQSRFIAGQYLGGVGLQLTGLTCGGVRRAQDAPHRVTRQGQ